MESEHPHSLDMQQDHRTMDLIGANKRRKIDKLDLPHLSANDMIHTTPLKTGKVYSLRNSGGNASSMAKT